MKIRGVEIIMMNETYISLLAFMENIVLTAESKLKILVYATEQLIQ